MKEYIHEEVTEMICSISSGGRGQESTLADDACDILVYNTMGDMQV